MSHLFYILRLNMLRHETLFLETWEIPSAPYIRRRAETLSHSATSRGRGRTFQFGESLFNKILEYTMDYFMHPYLKVITVVVYCLRHTSKKFI